MPLWQSTWRRAEVTILAMDLMEAPTHRPVGILGGMGPAAGAAFAARFVQACTDWLRQRGMAVHDQAFPEHWLVQAPVPDRSAWLAEANNGATPDAASPLAAMQHALQRLAAVGVRSAAVACNTAHAWHAELQALVPGVELLHIADELALALWAQGFRRVGLMATTGTHASGLYEAALRQRGIVCEVPTVVERQRVMHGIYAGVKAGDLALARREFEAVSAALVQRTRCEAVIMGCTEIPLALSAAPAGAVLVDPADVLAAALAERAYGAGVPAPAARAACMA